MVRLRLRARRPAANLDPESGQWKAEPIDGWELQQLIARLGSGLPVDRVRKRLRQSVWAPGSLSCEDPASSSWRAALAALSEGKLSGSMCRRKDSWFARFENTCWADLPSRGKYIALSSEPARPRTALQLLNTFEQRLLGHIENQAGETATLESRIADLDKKIRNCTLAIAEGRAFKTAFSNPKCGKTGAQLESILSKGLKTRIRNTRRFVESNLRDLQNLNRDPKLARAELARHIRKIVLAPNNGT